MILELLPRMGHQQSITPRVRVGITDLMYVLSKLLAQAERATCQLNLHREALDTMTMLIDDQLPYTVQMLAVETLYQMTQWACNIDYCPAGMSSGG